MTRKEAVAAVKQILVGCGDVWAHKKPNGITVEPSYRSYAEWNISFDKLEELSIALGTRDINFKTAQGFGGSDVTGPDPSRMELVILMEFDR